MDTDTLNKAITGRWFASFWGDAFDPAIVDELAATNVVLQYAMHRRLCGRLALKTFMAEFRAAFPDLSFRQIGAMIADRDLVVIRWDGSGTHTGPAFDDFNLGSLPTRSGRRIALSGHTAVRLEDGLIVEEAVWAGERKRQLRLVAGGLIGNSCDREPRLSSPQHLEQSCPAQPKTGTP